MHPQEVVWHLEAALHPHTALNHAVAAANLLPSSSAAASSFLLAQPEEEPAGPVPPYTAPYAGSGRGIGSALTSSSSTIRQRQLQDPGTVSVVPLPSFSSEQAAPNRPPGAAAGRSESEVQVVPSFYPSQSNVSNVIPGSAAVEQRVGRARSVGESSSRKISEVPGSQSPRTATGNDHVIHLPARQTAAGIPFDNSDAEAAALHERRSSSFFAGPAPKAQASDFTGFCNVAQALSSLLTAAQSIAEQVGVALLVNHPLYIVRSSKAKPKAPGLNPKPSLKAEDAVGALELLPRPSRPLNAGVEPNIVQRVMAYVVDIALQCTPKGGQVAVSAKPAEGGVQIAVVHTGRMCAQRLHARSLARIVPMRSSSSSSRPAAVSGAMYSRRVPEPGAVVPADVDLPCPTAQPPSAAAPALRTTNTGLVSLEFAQQLIEEAGGRISIMYPGKVLNAMTGILDVGTSVEIWLPGPQA